MATAFSPSHQAIVFETLAGWSSTRQNRSTFSLITNIGAGERRRALSDPAQLHLPCLATGIAGCFQRQPADGPHAGDSRNTGTTIIHQQNSRSTLHWPEARPAALSTAGP